MEVTRDPVSGLWRKGNVLSRKKPRAHPEDDFHMALYTFARHALPEDARFVTWESRGGGVYAGANRKARGQVKGWPDVGIFWRRTCIFFELKAARNGADEVQRRVHADLQALGFRVFVIQTIEQFIAALESCGMVLRAKVLA